MEFKIGIATLFILSVCFIIAHAFNMYYNKKIPGNAFRDIWDISIHRCNKECLARTKCKSFNYVRRYGQCALHEINVNGQELGAAPGCVFVAKSSVDEALSPCQSVCSVTAVCEVENRKPACIVRECPEPPVIIRTTVKGNMRSVGVRILYVCNAPYIVDPALSPPVTSSSTCLKNGTWSAVNISCKFQGTQTVSTMTSPGRTTTIDCPIPDTFTFPTWSGPLVDGTKRMTIVYTSGGSSLISPALPHKDRVSYASNSRSLVIRDIQASDGGVYTCWKWSYSSGQNVVVVQAETKTMTTNSGIDTVVECPLPMEFTLPAWTCDIERRKVYQITSDGSPVIDSQLPHNDRVTYASNNKSLVIRNIQASDAGVYTCTKWSYSSGQNVIRVEATPMTTAAFPGKHTVINCPIQMEFTLPTWTGPLGERTVQLTQDGSPLISAALSHKNRVSYSSDNRSLVINNTQASDAGVYTCTKWSYNIGWNTLVSPQTTQTTGGSRTLNKMIVDVKDVIFFEMTDVSKPNTSGYGTAHQCTDT